jgi:hypothetical protein
VALPAAPAAAVAPVAVAVMDGVELMVKKERDLEADMLAAAPGGSAPTAVAAAEVSDQIPATDAALPAAPTIFSPAVGMLPTDPSLGGQPAVPQASVAGMQVALGAQSDETTSKVGAAAESAPPDWDETVTHSGSRPQTLASAINKTTDRFAVEPTMLSANHTGLPDSGDTVILFDRTDSLLSADSLSVDPSDPIAFLVEAWRATPSAASTLPAGPAESPPRKQGQSEPRTPGTLANTVLAASSAGPPSRVRRGRSSAARALKGFL